MDQPTIEVDRLKFGVMVVLLVAILLAVYVFDVPPALGIVGQIGLLCLMLRGFSWRLMHNANHDDQFN